MSVLNDDSIVICGERREGDGHKLKSYNLHTGRELISVDLQASVEAMVEVKLRDDSTLTLTYRSVVFTRHLSLYCFDSKNKEDHNSVLLQILFIS